MPRVRLLPLLALCLLPLGCTTTHIASSTPGQITVGPALSEFQGILTGSPLFNGESKTLLGDKR